MEVVEVVASMDVQSASDLEVGHAAVVAASKDVEVAASKDVEDVESHASEVVGHESELGSDEELEVQVVALLALPHSTHDWLRK